MKKSDSNRLNMYHAVLTVCTKHQDTWENVKGFVDAFEQFQAKMKAIAQEIEVQKKITTGVRKEKLDSKKLLASIASRVAGAITNYAISNNDSALIDEVSLAESSILRGRATESLQYCEALHKTATSLLEVLGDHGVDQSVLDEFLDKISDFAELLAGPRVAIARRKVATSRLSKLFTATSKILSMQMDNLMKIFEEANSDFYEEYYNARSVINLRRGKMNIAPDSSPEDESEDDGPDIGSGMGEGGTSS